MHTPPPFALFDMDRQDGQYLISHYGGLMAFGFHGSSRFVELAENLVINYGFTNGDIHKLNEHIYYVIMSEEKLEKVLGDFFAAAIRLTEWQGTWFDGGDDSEGEVVWDESRIKPLVTQRVRWFMDKIVKRDNFMLDTSRDGIKVTS